MNWFQTVLTFILLCGAYSNQSLENNNNNEEAIAEKLLWKVLSDDNYELQFSAFGKTFLFNLIPKPIFEPNFTIISHDDEEPLEEKSEQLTGSFFIAENDYASFYVEKHDDEIHLDGLISEQFRIFNDNGVNKIIPLVHSIKTRAVEKPSMKKSKKTETSESVYIKIIVLVNNTYVEIIEKDNKQSLKKYLGIYWNLVERRFTDFTNPKIDFSLAGVVKVGNQLTNAEGPKGLLNAHIILETLPNWLYENLHRLPSFNLAVLLTESDLTSSTWNPELKGLAEGSAICKIDGEKRVFYSIALSEDKPPLFTGVLTTAHEVAHVLGADHDGEGNGVTCEADDGFIMTPSTSFGKNAWHFSNCSIKSIEKRLKIVDCLKTPKESKWKILKVLPGIGFTFNDVCRKWFTSEYKAYVKGKQGKPCRKLYCRAYGQLKSYGPAPEGTTCGRSKICVDGSCVTIKSQRHKGQI